MSNKLLGLEDVSVSFGQVVVFRDLSLDISESEFVAVVGPSGCGKTTLLNLFSGFVKPSSGSVTCSGRVRMVYQHDSLFPWQTAAQNIALGLRHLGDEAELGFLFLDGQCVAVDGGGEAALRAEA